MNIPKEAVLQLNNPAVTNSTPQAETNVEKKKKKTIKQKNRAHHEIVKGDRFNIQIQQKIIINIPKRRSAPIK